MPTYYHALIRTHHIRSRSKVNQLKSAAKQFELAYVLFKSDGAPPGMMYACGTSEEGVDQWVREVRSLHYLNFELQAPVTMIENNKVSFGSGKASKKHGKSDEGTTVVEEVATLKDFAAQMKQRHVLSWWRQVMGFKTDGA